MNSKFKRLLACLLSLMMVVSIFPMSAITAFAAEADEIATVSESTIASSGTWGGIDWTLTTDGTFTVSPAETPVADPNCGKVYESGDWRENVVYNTDGTVRAVGTVPYNAYKSQVKKLVIEEGVTSIGAWCANGFTNLTGELVIPSTVKHIGQEALQNSTFTKLTFAKGGTEELCIGQGALKNLIVEEIVFPDDRPVHLHAWMFLNSKNLKSITFPANLTSVKGTNHHAFWAPNVCNSGNLNTSVIVNTTNTALEAMAFSSEDSYKLVCNSDNSYIKTFGAAAVKTSDGSFITCKSLAIAVNHAQSGDTIKLLKNTDEAVEIPAGVTLDLNGFTAPNVTIAKPAVAQIGETPYESLTKAIAAAQAGQTITFLADITEDVTISKAVTIDGAGKTYTGSMTLKADTTIKNVNFDGKGYNGYAVNTRGAQYVTIEDCTVKNYGYGFAQLPSATALTTVKNVTVSNVNYGVKVDYSGAVVLENVDITAGIAAVLNSNYGKKTITIKDSKLNIIGTYTRNNTTETAYVFEGANTVSQFIIEEALDSFKLAAGATLTAPNAVTVTTDVEDGTVVYEDGKYYVQTGLAGSGTQADPYQISSVEDLVKFRDSVNAGETKYNAEGVYVVLTADIDLSSVANWAPIGTFDYSFDGNFNGQGHKIMNLKMSDNTAATGEAYLGFFGVTANNTVENFVIENVSIESNGQIVAAAIAYPYYTTVKDITVCGDIAIKGGHYTAGVLAYTRLCQNASNLTVSGNAGSYITGVNVVGGVIADIQMNNGLAANYSNFKVANVTITGNKCVGGISGIIAKQKLDGANVENVTLVCSDARVGVVAGSFGGASTIKNVVVSNVTGATAIVGGLYDGGKAVQAVANDTYYATLEDALAATNAGDEITLLTPYVVEAGKEVTIDLAGKTITQSVACTKSYDMILNKGSLTINDSVGGGKISFTDTSAGDPNFGWGSYTIRNEGTLVVNGGTIEHKGAQAFATHMICAIFQYSGSTTINGGTFSTPNYRSIRLWKGDLTINGGAFDGQIWVQAVDNSAKLTINGGTFEPNGQDASAVFVSNATYDVAFAVTGGTFNGKIGANDASKVAGAISGGLFNEAAKNGTNAALLADNFVFKANGNGYYGIAAPVASVNGVEYATLEEAIKAATAGSTITLLADVNENVTIDKNLTIDGADKNYTGTMTIKNVTVTIENVNFVKGQIYKNKNTGTTANVTIKNCNFDGQGMNAYAINLGGTKSIVIENVTAKDYGYGLLQVPSSCAGLTVKNVTVSGCYYGLKVDYANAVTIENADIDANIGIYDSNYGTKTYTIKNSKISSISIWDRKTGLSTTFKFEGVNEVATLSTSAYAKYEGVQVGTKIYDSLANAWAAAQDGDTIKLLGNIATTDAITNIKKITLDLNGKTITGTDNATGSFGLITNKGELTITGNGKITLVATNDRDWNAYSSVISNTVGGKLIVENGTIEHLGGTDMAYGIDNLTNGKNTYAETIINGGTIKSTYRGIRQFLNGVEAQNILTVNGGVVEGANKSIWVQDPSKNNNTGKITVAAGAVLNGDVYLTATAGSAEWPVEVSIAASAVKDEVLTSNLPAGYVLEKKSGNWTVNEYFFKVGNKYYKDLQAAVNAASQYQSVVLLQDAEGAGVVINKKISIDFAGFTYTITAPVGSKGTESNGFQILAGNYAVRLLNGTLKVADSAADKFYILVQNYADLTVQKMTLDGTNLDKYAFTDGDSYTLSNNSGNVNINMSTIIANNDGDKAFAFDACDKSAWGYELPRVIVYTGSKIEGKIEAVAKVGNYYYATLQQAIDATAEGKTITLLAPIVVKAGETLNLNKKVTISYTSKVPGEDMITNRGAVIVDGATLVYKNTDTTASNVTVSTISCEPGSVLEVNSGVVKNNSANNGALGIYAYAIDMLTNGNMGDVTVTVSGGKVIGTNYMAIRQFNNGTACKNSLTVTGGEIYGAKRAIQIHMDNNAAYLAISGGKVEAGKDGYALCLFPKAATNVAVTGGEFVGTIYSGTNGFITGGTYDAAVYEGYITESYKMVKVDGVYNVIFDETYGSVATIGDKKFNSFAAAWAAAQNGDTIVLQNNIAIDTETFTVADGKKITLDMNGYTITVTDNATKNYELFYIYGEMVVTGKGTIALTSTNNRAWNAMSAIFHNRGGVLTIENGTYTNLGGTDMAWVVDNSANYYGDAITNINGGTLTSTYTAIRNRMEQNSHGASGKAILNVTGGKIDGTTSAIWAQAASVSTVAPATGEINISGGEIGLINTARSEGAVSMTTITGGTVAGFKGESGELKVNGGTITGDITILFADGTEPVKTVVKSKVYYGAVAKMGSTYYATLADAIKKCTGAQAITLLRDIEGEGFVITGKTAIDFNGHTYTVTAPVAGTNVGVQINASGKAVRLINGTLKAAEGSGVEVLVESNSTLTIQKQTLVATSGKALVVTGGSASINLATINAENAVAFEVVAGKITVYSEGTSSVIKGEKLAKKSGTSYVAK